MKLEKLTDEQLAKRMSKYISLIQSITVRAEYYSLGRCSEAEMNELVSDFLKVRDGIREDSTYLNYNRDKKAVSFYGINIFRRSARRRHGVFMQNPKNPSEKNFSKVLKKLKSV